MPTLTEFIAGLLHASASCVPTIVAGMEHTAAYRDLYRIFYQLS